MKMQKKRFKKIYIEITNKCNLSCSFCKPDHRKKQYMTKEQFTKIISKIKPYTDYIYLHVKGEPLLHPDINELIEIAYQEGIHVNITTNGTCLRNISNKHIRQINYSIQSSTSLQKTKEIIQQIKEFIKNTNILVSLRLWTTKSKEDEEIVQMLQQEFPKMTGLKDRQTISENIFLSIEEEFQWPTLEQETYDTEGTCYGLRDQIAILVDGTVVPCCLDDEGTIVLGNIMKQELEEIIHTQRVEKIIKGFENRKAVEELCQKCTFKNKF